MSTPDIAHYVMAIDYTLHLDDGQVVDSSQGRGPLQFVEGVGAIIPGLESQLTGLAVGDHADVVVSPAQAYGEYDPNLTLSVPRDAFPADLTPEVGVAVQLQDPEGEVRPFWITEIAENTVTLDGNHPLAGETLHFAVDVVDKRPATDEEYILGEVHSDHAHSH